MLGGQGQGLRIAVRWWLEVGMGASAISITAALSLPHRRRRKITSKEIGINSAVKRGRDATVRLQDNQFRLEQNAALKDQLEFFTEASYSANPSHSHTATNSPSSTLLHTPTTPKLVHGWLLGCNILAMSTVSSRWVPMCIHGTCSSPISEGAAWIPS